MKSKIWLSILAAILFSAACTAAPPPAPSGGGGGAAPPAPSDTPVVETEPYPIEIPPVTTEDGYPPPDIVPSDGYPAPEDGYPAPGDCTVDPALPQQVEFPTADGLQLAGTYYPSALCDAPIVVLFHQFGSSREAWTDLALWMQNRAGETGSTGAGWLASPLLQADYLPPMPADLSFAVLAVDFRGHGESPAGDEDGLDADGYLRDAQAAMAYARTLLNVNPNHILTLGASIGADAAVDACQAYEGDDVADTQVSQGCIGALSLSPGSFLEVPYADTVTRLGQAPFSMIVRCVATENDGVSPDHCNGTYGSHFAGTVYAGRSEHGMALLASGFDPNIGDLILSFLTDSLAAAP